MDNASKGETEAGFIKMVKVEKNHELFALVPFCCYEFHQTIFDAVDLQNVQRVNSNTVRQSTNRRATGLASE